MTPTSAEPAAGRRARRGATHVATGILLSRLAGLARERVIAAELGVGVAVDAFRAALRIPNLLQNLLGEGVLSGSFIPVYSRLLAEGDEERAGRVAGAVASLLAAAAAVVVVVGVVFARPLTILLAPGFTGERLDLTVRLTRILFPSVGILVLSAWCLGVLNSHRRFFLAYVAPVLWNGAQIAVLVVLGLRGLGAASLAEGLAWGALAGAVLQLAVQVIPVRRCLGPLRLGLRTDLPEVRTVLRRLGPVAVGRGVVQLSAYVDLLLASLLAVGAVAALGYASVLYLLPISLFGMSVAAAELPELSRLGTDRAVASEVAARLEDGLARIAFFVLPTAAAYVAFGDVIVAALFETGAFGADDTRLVWYVLAAFSVGLLATTAGRLLQNALYAAGDPRTPARAAAVRVALAAGLGVLLMFQLDRVVLEGPGPDGVAGLGDLPAAVAPLPAALREGGSLRLGAVGLALASGTAAWVELGVLRRAVRARVGAVRVGGPHLGRIALAAGGAVVVGVTARALSGPLPPLAALVVVAAPSAGAYLGAARALGVPEVSRLRPSTRRRA